jgi:RNA polymerase sigma factor (sigma-70 family)
MSTAFGIRITAQARHADLWEAAQKCGGNSALCRMLKLHESAFGHWVNLRACPVFEEDLKGQYVASMGRRIAMRLKRLEKKLFKVTGKLLEDIWPRELRAAIRNGKIATRIDFRQDIDLKLLTVDFQARALLPSPEDLAARAEVQESFDDLLKTLTFRQRQIIEMRFGLNGQSYTLEEVGKVFKLTKDRIRQIENTAINRLRERADRLGFPAEEMLSAIDATRGAIVANGHASILPFNEQAAAV